jgi:LmbE family N-acetylglucosaminyl deacetylase/protein-L-isoaspartate O-methyltransferase
MKEELWRRQPELCDLPPFAWLDRSGMPPARLVVAVAHPDDETLVAGGLLHEAGVRGIPTLVVVATAGEASHPGSPTHPPALLAERRRRELQRAVTSLNPRARWRVLELPDSQVAAHEAALTGVLDQELDSSTLVVSTWRHDGHPDHEATARAAAAAAAAAGARHVEAPLWAWSWQGPDAIPWDHATQWALSTTSRHAKEAALTAYTSQTQALSAHPADAAVVDQETLAHFVRHFEVLLEDPATPPPTVFDDLYDRGSDPWSFADSWYEARKRALTMAALPSHDLGRVLELGPADGQLTVLLAERARSLVAVDVSPRATAIARRRVDTAGLGERVDLRVGRLPAAMPARVTASGTPERFDTVLVAELAYFLGAQEWATTLHRIRELLAPEGVLVLVHWMHPIDGWPLTGDTVHDLARSVTGLATTVHHAEADFELRVLQPPGLPSLAESEGRRERRS